MLKSFRKLVKKFQSVPERDFQNGRTKEQVIYYLASLGADSSQVEYCVRYLYAHDPDIRQAAVSALKGMDWSAKSAAEMQVWNMYTSGGQTTEPSVEELLQDWEGKTSLAPGAYWTPVVLTGLVQLGEKAKPDLYAAVQDASHGLNARALALWAIGLLEKQPGQYLADVYRAHINHRVQRAAIQALRFCGPDSLPVLGALLREEKDEDLILETALAMGWMGKAAVAELVKLLDSEKRMVREYAGLGLLASADSQGVTQLLAFKSSSRDGRLKAMITEWMVALGGDASTWKELSTPRSAAELCSADNIVYGLARTDNEVLVLVCLSMLAHMPDDKAVSYILELIRNTDQEEVIFQACQTAGAQGADSELKKMLGQGNPLLRTHACLALLKAQIPVMQVLAAT
ncbi:MAG: hypothetical protein R6V55_02900 [Desulfovermiculus sp.]